MRCFVWNNKYYKLNVYSHPEEVTVLEVEDSSEDPSLSLIPPFLKSFAATEENVDSYSLSLRKP